MKKLILLLLALLPALSAGAQAPFAKYLDQAEGAPFIVIDKQRPLPACASSTAP